MSEEFKPGNQYDDDNIICPYCGYAREAVGCDGDNDPSETDEDCEECGKTFTRWADISVSYQTQQKK